MLTVLEAVTLITAEDPDVTLPEGDDFLVKGAALADLALLGRITVAKPISPGARRVAAFLLRVTQFAVLGLVLSAGALLLTAVIAIGGNYLGVTLPDWFQNGFVLLPILLVGAVFLILVPVMLVGMLIVGRPVTLTVMDDSPTGDAARDALLTRLKGFGPLPAKTWLRYLESYNDSRQREMILRGLVARGCCQLYPVTLNKRPFQQAMVTSSQPDVAELRGRLNALLAPNARMDLATFALVAFFRAKLTRLRAFFDPAGLRQINTLRRITVAAGAPTGYADTITLLAEAVASRRQSLLAEKQRTGNIISTVVGFSGNIFDRGELELPPVAEMLARAMTPPAAKPGMWLLVFGGFVLAIIGEALAFAPSITRLYHGPTPSVVWIGTLVLGGYLINRGARRMARRGKLVLATGAVTALLAIGVLAVTSASANSAAALVVLLTILPLATLSFLAVRQVGVPFVWLVAYVIVAAFVKLGLTGAPSTVLVVALLAFAAGYAYYQLFRDLRQSAARAKRLAPTAQRTGK